MAMRYYDLAGPYANNVVSSMSDPPLNSANYGIYNGKSWAGQGMHIFIVKYKLLGATSLSDKLGRFQQSGH
jgi:hypothetical protein